MESYMWQPAFQDYVNLLTGEHVGGFIPGVTKPYYEVTEDFSGAKNVGVQGTLDDLTTYTGTITDGWAVLNGGTYEGILFPCFIELRAPTHFKNCAQLIPENWNYANSIQACIFSGNGGAGNTGSTFENFEIHNRSQRPLKGMTVRNCDIDQMVITGCFDGWSDGFTGSAPLNYAFNISNSIIPALSYWYSNPPNPEVHGSDTHTHADGIQKRSNALHADVTNSVFQTYVDDVIGTGTPGSGVDAGNTYAPASGNNYIVSQSQMSDWRDQFCSTFTEPSQSKGGVSHRLTDASYAGLMANGANIDFFGCEFSGGTVAVNAVDGNLGTGTVDIGFTDCIFWNDMKNGHGANPANKGHAVLMLSDRTLETFVNNRWATDNSLITRTTEGAYVIYR